MKGIAYGRVTGVAEVPRVWVVGKFDCGVNSFALPIHLLTMDARAADVSRAAIKSEMKVRGVLIRAQRSEEVARY